MKYFKQIVLLCLLALLPAVLAGFFHPKKPAWTLQPAEGEIALEILLKQGKAVLWLDARSAATFQEAHIPGALLLNEDNWDQLLVPVLDRWEPGRWVVVYCDSRVCDASHSVAKRLRAMDIHPVYVLQGGWETWKAYQE